MNTRRLTVGVLASAFLVLFALPAVAQVPPGAPGARALHRLAALTGLPSTTGAGNLGGVLSRAAGANPVPSAPPLVNPPQTGQSVNPPAASSAPAAAPSSTSTRPSRSSLPATGAPIIALFFGGIALISGGRMLRELVPATS